MKIDVTGVVIICGNFGSGKTETAINLALKKQADGIDVAIADLDLVNPYFRTRQAKTTLEKAGIKVVLPENQYMHADLPIVSSKVAGLIKNPSQLTILDAGGDDSGVRVLSSLNDSLSLQKIQMLWVINPFRPETADIKRCIRMQQRIQAAANLEITGLIGNANLIDETTPEHIYNGYQFVKKVCTATGLGIKFITMPSHLLSQMATGDFECPILEINRNLTLPWKEVAK